MVSLENEFHLQVRPTSARHLRLIIGALRCCSTLAVLWAARPAHAQTPDVRAERTTWLMGTSLTIVATASSAERGFGAIECAFDSVRAYEALLSTWRDDTGLSRLNRAPVGTWVDVPPPLARLLAELWPWPARTGGAFDPGVGALVDAWDLRGRGRRPSPARLSRALAASGLRHFELAVTRHAARRLTADAWLDAGGFGKGAALRAASRALRAAGVRSASLNFGGQVVALTASDGPAWRVPVAHPHQRQSSVVTLSLANRAAATSGQSERGITVGSERLGHILDPRTGSPVPAWGSVTVVHPDALEADILATALFVLGPETGMAWATDHRIAALFLIVASEPAAHPAARPAARCTLAMTPYIADTTLCEPHGG